MDYARYVRLSAACVVGFVSAGAALAASQGSLGATSSVGGRMVMVLVGIAVSLVGIMGVLNRAFLSKAIWKK